MTYAKIIDGAVVKYPFTAADMKADFPELDFTSGFTDEVLAACSAVAVELGPVPPHSNSTHTFHTTVELDDAGKALAVITAQKRRPEEAAYNIRQARDITIKQTDWVITRSVERGEPVPKDYADYREALRDITEQEGFPFDVVWPSYTPSPK